MSLAIKWGQENSDAAGMIYMDAVTVYTQNYTGSVTKHPVDSGVNITDHYIKDNATFSISAVITSVDVSTGSYLIQDLDGNSPYNVRQAPNPVNVTSTDRSVLQKFIPDSLGQFLPDSQPDVTMDEIRADLLDQVRGALINLTSGVRFNEETAKVESNIELIQLYEFDENNLLKRIINNLVVTSIRFNEDANSGYALYCDIGFEQVSFVDIRKVDIPKAVIAPLQKKASTKKTLGKCDSTVKDTDNPDNKDPQGKKDAIEDVDPFRTVPNEEVEVPVE